MHSLSPCHHRVTDEEAKAGGRLKPFGSSGNESRKDVLWTWWKWIEIPWQRQGAESASLHDLKGTTKARHWTPRAYRDVLGEDCCVQLLPERHEHTSLAPANVSPRLLCWQPRAIHLCVSPRSSSATWVSPGLPIRWSTKAPACLKQSPRVLVGKGAALPPGFPLYLPNMFFAAKGKHLLPTHGKTEKPASEDEIWREKNCFSCSCRWGAACNQGGREPVGGMPALRTSLGNVPGKPCLPQMVKYLAF